MVESREAIKPAERACRLHHHKYCNSTIEKVLHEIHIRLCTTLLIATVSICTNALPTPRSWTQQLSAAAPVPPACGLGRRETVQSENTAITGCHRRGRQGGLAVEVTVAVDGTTAALAAVVAASRAAASAASLAAIRAATSSSRAAWASVSRARRSSSEGNGGHSTANRSRTSSAESIRVST
jgi:hypothetical protein